MPRRTAAFVLSGALLVVAACSESGSTSAPTAIAAPPTTTTAARTTANAPTTSLAAPSGDAIYTPPSPLPVQQPGNVIWARSFPGPTGSTGYTVLYVSSTVDNTPIAVSGVGIVPGAGAPVAPPEGRTVLA